MAESQFERDMRELRFQHGLSEQANLWEYRGRITFDLDLIKPSSEFLSK